MGSHFPILADFFFGQFQNSQRHVSLRNFKNHGLGPACLRSGLPGLTIDNYRNLKVFNFKQSEDQLQRKCSMAVQFVQFVQVEVSNCPLEELCVFFSHPFQRGCVLARRVTAVFICGACLFANRFKKTTNFLEKFEYTLEPQTNI